MAGNSLPLLILGGSDRKPVALPDGTDGVHPLAGVKALDIRIGGRPLIDLVIERFHQAGAFDPIYLAGPRAVYGERRSEAEVLDTDASFGRNLQTGVAAVSSRHPGSPLAVSTCDVLPEPEDLQRLLSDYQAHAPLDFWFSLIRAPEDPDELGASSWKPQYRIKVGSRGEARTTLPGHLVIVDPAAVRLSLVYRSFDLAYRTRNRPIFRRVPVITSGVLLRLLREDLRHLMALRLPTMTVSVLYNGIVLAYHLAKGVVSEEELARRLRRIFVSYRHRKRFPERRGRVRLMEGLSLAKDIDTQEEAAELEAELAG